MADGAATGATPHGGSGIAAHVFKQQTPLRCVALAVQSGVHSAVGKACRVHVQAARPHLSMPWQHDGSQSCPAATRLGGVRMISADSGTLTVDRRSAVSPLAGGETTVKLNWPLALPAGVASAGKARGHEPCCTACPAAAR